MEKSLTPQDIATYGINTDNLIEGACYDANVIIQCFGTENEKDKHIICPTIYMPRKETCFNAEIDLSDEEVREEYLRHLRDSQERLKILSAFLHKQEKEIEEYGYPKTTCYYPDIRKL